MQNKKVLWVGATPAIAFVMFYWAIELWKYDAGLEFALLPLGLAALALVLWAPVTRGLLFIADKRQSSLVWGPFWECIALLALFTPWIMAAVAFPYFLKADPGVTTVSVVAVSVVLSNVIAEPFTRFVKALM